MIIPDLHRILQTRPDIIIDSPNTVEDVEKVLQRLGVSPVVPEQSSVRDDLCHMTHADVYCALFDSVIKDGHNFIKTLQLQAYLNRNVYSIR